MDLKWNTRPLFSAQSVAVVVLIQILLLQITSLFFQDSGQIPLKYTLLPFHYKVTNENSILNVLSVKQEHSFFHY